MTNAQQPSIQHLLQTLCPDGVPYAALGEVCSIVDGFPFDTKDFTDKDCGIAPIIKITDIKDGRVLAGKFYALSRPDKLKETQILSGQEILVSMSGSTGKTGFNIGLTLAFVNQRIAIIRANTEYVKIGFLKHLLVNNKFEEYCFKLGTGPQKNIGKMQISNFPIPLPPLPIQERIVEILDKFSRLSAELEAELELRKKQYDFYRNRLLSFDSISDTNTTEQRNKG